jgi:hypothetical protein
VTVAEDSLGHVVIVGGTAHEWFDMSVTQWEERLSVIVQGSAVAGPRWITLMPHSGESLSAHEYESWNTMFEHDIKTKAVTTHGWTRHVFDTDDGVSVIVDPCPNAKTRFTSVLDHMRTTGLHDVSEIALGKAVLAPADLEPDLVVILGPADRMPTSLVWELGYSELVFLDLSWADLVASHLEIAVDDFHRRQRRFGGLDS